MSAEKALDKLERCVNIGYYLSPKELQSIKDACCVPIEQAFKTSPALAPKKIPTKVKKDA